MAGTKPETYQIMVLSSGNSRGSNLAAMHRFFTMQEIPVRIALVVYTKRSAPIAGLCASLGIPALWISSKDPEAFERQVLHQVMTGDISLIALAGFLKQLSAGFISQLGNIPILNIHPALLPDFGGKGMYGHRVHESVFNSKEQFSGATIHNVDPLYDHGEIVAREQVYIADCSSSAEVAARVLKAEHFLYPRTIWNILRPS